MRCPDLHHEAVVRSNRQPKHLHTAMSMIGSAPRRAALPHPAGTPVLGAVGVLAFLVILAVLGSPRPAGASSTQPDERPDGTTISGVVVDEAGTRHLGVIVKLHEVGVGDEPGPEIRPAYTGVDGRYRFEDLEPGCYQVEVDAPAGTTFDDGAPATTHRICTTAGETAAELRAETRPEDEARSGTEATTAADSTRSVEIVHIGHHLGQLEPSTVRLELAGAEVDTEVGGWPRVVTAIEAARPVDAPESTITVNTGGVLAGSALAHLFGGAADAAILNRACFDYLAPSPEDRARADEWEIFRHFLDGTPCQTTVLDADGPARPAAASSDPAVAIHAVGSTPVGLVAVAADPTSGSDPVVATAARVEELVDEGTTIIIVISGLGLDADRALARQLPAVDAIVGSGPGSLLGDVADLGLETGGPYPDRTFNADGDPVCLGHTGVNATAVGRLRIEIDQEGRVSDCGGQIQLLVGRRAVVVAEDETENGDENEVSDTEPDDEVTPPSAAEIAQAVTDHPLLVEVAPDLETSRALDRWSKVRDLLLDDPVARVTTDLCRTRVPGRSVGLLCGTGDRVVDTTAPRADAQRLVADAFRHRSAQLDLPAIALIDSQTVSETIAPGPLSTIAAYRLVAPTATLSVVRLTGAELTAVLQERIEAALDGTPGAYPHTSGLRLTPDLTRPGRPRLGPIEILDRSDHWRPLDPAAAYRVVVPDRFLSDRESSPTLATLGPERTTRTTVGAAEALLDYVDDVLGGVVDPPGTPPGGLDPEADPMEVERREATGEEDGAEPGR